VGQFGIGQAVRRKEDVRFITGTGRYTDDIDRPNQAYAHFLRSPHAHAAIRAIDVSAAKAAPGVIGVYTAADVAEAGLDVIKAAPLVKNRDGSDHPNPGRTLLAADRVRHVGDPVVLIVAETRAAAEDAAELVEIDYDPLPAVVDAKVALAPGAPLVNEAVPGNLALDWELGDKAATDAVFAKAARVVSVDLFINRIVVASIEPRGVVAEFDEKVGRYTVHMGTQGVFGMRRTIAKNLKVGEERVRVVTPDVGGSFGMKGFDYPEYSLLPWAAKLLGRPVKWTSTRQEAFQSDTQGREQHVHAELALDADHRFLAIRCETAANMGAYLSFYALLIATLAGFRLLTGAYRIPTAYVNVKAALTHTNWIDAYRGAGRPEVSYIVERLVDATAREVGLSPEEIRRRNFVPADAMPWKTPCLAVYDSGDFARNMELALARADWAGFPARREAAKARGKLAGIGLSYYMEVTANGPQEAADIRFEPNGRVTMRIGSGPSGQGHETAFAQILEDRLGLPFEAIDFVFGDSDDLKQGSGTGGAKTLMLAGTALVDVSDKIIAKGKKLAGHLMEASEADIEFGDGTFSIAGTDRRIGILELARQARETQGLPEELAGGLDETGHSTSAVNTYPNGCHICEVEIDRATGSVAVVRYTLVDDFGLVMNPLILEGQIHGGIMQGLGQALMEDAVFDAESGQLLSGSFMDYAMPRARDQSPVIDIAFNNVPCTTNVLGVKGAGEAGTVGALGAVMNAVVDALAPLGIRHIDMPATPQKVWRAIQAAGG
jgi:carbon-monoxide dehydrogenase large subunit